MRCLHRIVLSLALVSLAFSLVATQPRLSFSTPGIDPDPWVSVFPSTRQTVMSSLLYQYYEDGWLDSSLFSPEFNSQGWVSAISNTWWNVETSQWEDPVRLEISYRPDYRPLLVELKGFVDGEWVIYGNVTYLYVDDLIRMITYNQFWDGVSRPFWQVAFYYAPSTHILERMVEFYYQDTLVPGTVYKYDYIWDAGSRPSEIKKSVMSDMGDWFESSRDTYVYHNDDQTTHADYMRTLEFGWPIPKQLITGVLPSKLVEHRQYQKSTPNANWLEVFRDFYVYNTDNQLEQIDIYENSGTLGWEVNHRKTYTYESGLPVSETLWSDSYGQNELLADSRLLYTYTQITDADDPVAPPPQSNLKVYPNPFNPLTAISFKLETLADTEVSVYNLKGQKVRVLTSGSAGAGDHTLRWDGKDDQGRELAAGIYLIKLQAGKHSSIVKAVLQK